MSKTITIEQMAEAAAAVILDKLGYMQAQDAIAYIEQHETEIAEFAGRLLAESLTPQGQAAIAAEMQSHA